MTTIPEPISVIRYKSSDGSLHGNYGDALERNREIVAAAELEQKYLGGPRPDSVDFTNGKLGYIQHDFEKVRTLYGILLSSIPNKRDLYEHPVYGRLWVRVLSTDEAGREWGQPAMTIQRESYDNETCYEDRRK